VRVPVRLFAGLRERAGAPSIDVELTEPATVGGLLAALAETPVGALPPRSCIVAVNREYADPEQAIVPGDEVALIPPVSGGADGTGSPVRRAAIISEPPDLAGLSQAVRDPRAGAVVTFEGVTRAVDALHYEAYAEMAEPRMALIGEEEAARHGLLAVAIEHRIGRVPLSEPSVVIAVSAPHRAEAFAGARAILDRIKAEAPIWKQEREGERAEWVEGTLPTA
jgi:molybdopterin converting factor subunit 1